MSDKDTPEIEKILSLFSKEIPELNIQFEQRLRQRIIERYEQRNFFLNLTHIFEGVFMTNKWKTVGLTIIFLVFTFTSFSTYYVFQQKQREANKIPKLSQEQLQSIFANVARNNPYSLIQPSSDNTIGARNQLSAETADASAANNALKYAPAIYPGMKEYNYSHTKNNTSIGPALNSCPAMNYYQAGTVESWEYFGSEAENYLFSMKNKSLNQDGNLYSYLLETQDSRIEYMGGKYAVKTKTPNYGLLKSAVAPTIPESFAVEVKEETSVSALPNLEPETIPTPLEDRPEKTEPVTTDDFIRSYFGPDATLEEIVEENGKQVYVISWRYETPCEYSSQDKDLTVSSDLSNEMKVQNENTHVIITKAWIYADTFEIFREEIYLNEISSPNLLVRQETSTETKNIDSFDQVKSNFTFEYPIEVKEIVLEDYPTQYENYIKYVTEYLKANSFTIPYPRHQKYQLTYVNETAAYAEAFSGPDYLYDPDFYPAGEKGEAQFLEAVRSFYVPSEDEIQAKISLEFSATEAGETTYPPFSITIFDPQHGADEILQSFGFDEPTSYTQKEISLTLDNQKVNATLYTLAFPDGRAEQGFVPGSKGSEEMPDPTAIPDAVETGEPIEITQYVTYLVIFELNGHRYAIHSNTNVLDFETYLTFTDIKSNSDEFIDKVKDQLKNGISGRGNAEPIPPDVEPTTIEPSPAADDTLEYSPENP